VTIINHAVTGALVAAAIGKPAIALPAALLSHFAIDMLPHWDYEVPGDNQIKQAAVMIDATFSMATLLILAVTVSAPQRLIIAGGFLGVLPDIMWAQKIVTGSFSKNPNRYVEKIRKIHKKMQWSESRKGIYFEIFWLVLTLFLIYQI